LDVLNGKAYGDEATKQIYKIQDDDSALRFDLTIPMARYIAMNSNMPLPFKRYQVGQTWRRDEPQKMRFREFTQADIDIVGSDSVESEAEVLGAISLAIEGLGLRNYKILLSSRIMLDQILDSFAIPKEKQPAAIRALDKIAKIGSEEVATQMAQAGIDKRNAEKIIEFVMDEGTNEQKIERISANVPAAKDEIDRLERLINLLGLYNLQGAIEIYPALARGLDYYTGSIWEFVVQSNDKYLPTIAAGGRYDNLMDLYAKKHMPAVGASIGVDRIFELIEDKPIMPSFATLFVATIGDEVAEYALEIANTARAQGIYTDLNLTKRNISKQLEYANALKLRYAIIIGGQEKAAKKVKLRDLATGDEEMVDLSEAIEKIKG